MQLLASQEFCSMELAIKEVI